MFAPIVMGLALAACTGDDGGDTATSAAGSTGHMHDTGHDDAHDGTSSGGTPMTGTGDTAADTLMMTTDDAGEAEYGVPDTGEASTGGGSSSGGGTAGSSTDSGSESDSGSTSIGEPEYGVGETVDPEPPGPEPLYGAGISDEG